MLKSEKKCSRCRSRPFPLDTWGFRRCSWSAFALDDMVCNLSSHNLSSYNLSFLVCPTVVDFTSSTRSATPVGVKSPLSLAPWRLRSCLTSRSETRRPRLRTSEPRSTSISYSACGTRILKIGITTRTSTTPQQRNTRAYCYTSP